MMQSLVTLMIVVLAWAGHAADVFTGPIIGGTNRCAGISLTDQFDQPHTLKFPAAKPILLTVADKKGSEGIAAWAHPLAARFGEQIEIAGIADVSAVPKPLRSFVRGKFKKAIRYPIMLDWEGDVCARFAYARGKPNVFLIARDGRILLHISGEAGEARQKELTDAIEAELKSRR
jgi:hypothetical protein